MALGYPSYAVEAGKVYASSVVEVIIPGSITLPTCLQIVYSTELSCQLYGI